MELDEKEESFKVSLSFLFSGGGLPEKVGLAERWRKREKEIDEIPRGYFEIPIAPSLNETKWLVLTAYQEQRDPTVLETWLGP